MRSETSLVQTIGRAARNVDGQVILYADQMTGSMERAMAETNRRREKQEAYNDAQRHHARKRSSAASRTFWARSTSATTSRSMPASPTRRLIGHNFKATLADLEKRMREAAANLEFEEAARLRDEIKRLQATELAIGDDPLARQTRVEATRRRLRGRAQIRPRRQPADDRAAQADRRRYGPAQLGRRRGAAEG